MNKKYFPSGLEEELERYSQDPMIRVVMLPKDTNALGFIFGGVILSQLDLAALDVAAILVPTPGQPEQAFLGKLWAERFGFVCLTQQELEQGRIPDQATGALPACTANVVACRHLSAWLGSIRRRTD